jgi:hypothetical protein
MMTHPVQPGSSDLYVSPLGNDHWSGLLPEPNAGATDGPLATLGEARRRIRFRKGPPWDHEALRAPLTTAGVDGPVTVWVRAGTYELQEPLIFTAEDSGPFTFAAYPGEKPVISAGRRLTGFRVEKINGINAWVLDLPEVARGQWYFRSLFVNGERRQRPRLPKRDWYWMESFVPKADARQTTGLFAGTDRFVCKEGNVQPWKNITDVEVIALHYWVDEHMPIAAFDPATRVVTSSRTSIFVLNDDFTGKPAKYYVSNIFEALSEPGEWYLDRTQGRLYYIPMEGEDPETSQVVAPWMNQVLRLNGDPDQGQWVQWLRFVGLTFAHCDAQLPRGGWDTCATRELSPTVDYASAPQAAFNVPGAIQFTGARHCTIQDCTIEHVGWYGIELADGCWGNRIVGNQINDIGAGGVKINGSDTTGPVARRTGNNRVTDNHIHHAGRIFHQGIGVFIQHSAANLVAHNHIHDLFYSGVSVGWAWGFQDSVTKDNRVEKNHIHHLGFGWLSDMGGVYMLGVQPGSVVRGNVIHDIERANYGGWAIYLDEGSAHIVVENNICYDVSSECFHQHYGRENIIRNNIFAFGRDGLVAMSRSVPANSLTLTRNILVGDGVPTLVGGYSHKLEQPNSICDANLLWRTDGADPFYTNGGRGKNVPVAERIPLVRMRELGQDRLSVVADPKFKNAPGRDFTLGPDSPALALGFVPIDNSDVGIRPQGRRDV